MCPFMIGVVHAESGSIRLMVSLGLIVVLVRAEESTCKGLKEVVGREWVEKGVVGRRGPVS